MQIASPRYSHFNLKQKSSLIAVLFVFMSYGVYTPDYVSAGLWSWSLRTPDLLQPFAFSESGNDNHYVIPLKRAGNLIMVEAMIDSIYGNLILDSGSASVVLNNIYFRDGRRYSSVNAGGITGATTAISRARINALQISSLSFSSLEVKTSDLGHIEQARNIRVLGFFGLSLLSGFEIVIDLQNNVLELYRLDFRGRPIASRKSKPRFDIEIPARVESDVMFIEGYINGRKLTFCLDTGAESNVINSQLPARVLNTIDIQRRSILKGAGHNQIEVYYGVMNDFSINRIRLNGMNTLVTNLSTMSNFFGVRIDGMLGCDFLEKGIFYINMKQQHLGIILHKGKNNET
jgi:predicted aspartyl protease